MIDLLYVAFNRLEYTRATFEALVENTYWDEVSTLFVLDDGSTDGTASYLEERCTELVAQLDRAVQPARVVFHGERFGGPVAAMCWYLDHATPGVQVMGKVDNDMVVCQGWLPEMLRQLELHPGLDILGMEPMLGDPAMPGTVHRDIEPAQHIGGKGLIRLRAFDEGRPQPGGWNGYQGFTTWQTSHEEVTKAWIKPDLPVFGLDQVRSDDGPWRALAEGYAEKGWQRLWPVYGGSEHYEWWLTFLRDMEAA